MSWSMLEAAVPTIIGGALIAVALLILLWCKPNKEHKENDE